jgi:hypothetical protein
MIGASSVSSFIGGPTKSVTGMLAVAFFMNSVQIGSAASAPDKPILRGPSKPTQTTASRSGVYRQTKRLCNRWSCRSCRRLAG